MRTENNTNCNKSRKENHSTNTVPELGNPRAWTTQTQAWKKKIKKKTKNMNELSLLQQMCTYECYASLSVLLSTLGPW